MNYPECINAPEKLDYWISYCSSIEKFKFFYLNFLVPQSKYLLPIQLIKLLKNISFAVKGKYPELTTDIDSYCSLCEQAVLTQYRLTLHPKVDKV